MAKIYQACDLIPERGPFLDPSGGGSTLSSVFQQESRYDIAIDYDAPPEFNFLFDVWWWWGHMPPGFSYEQLRYQSGAGVLVPNGDGTFSTPTMRVLDRPYFRSATEGVAEPAATRFFPEGRHVLSTLDITGVQFETPGSTTLEHTHDPGYMTALLPAYLQIRARFISFTGISLILTSAAPPPGIPDNYNRLYLFEDGSNEPSIPGHEQSAYWLRFTDWATIDVPFGSSTTPELIGRPTVYATTSPSEPSYVIEQVGEATIRPIYKGRLETELNTVNQMILDQNNTPRVFKFPEEQTGETLRSSKFVL